MSTPSAALNQQLRSRAAITGLVADRIYPGRVPQESKTPYIAFLRIDENEEEAFGGNADLRETAFEIIVVAKGYEDCELLYEEVRDACRRFDATTDGIVVDDTLLRRGQGPESVTEPALFQATQEIAMRYRRTV